jgi:anti-anti-sigma regulatory factor
MLSILTSVTKNIATVSMIGMLHNDDRDVINCFFKTLRDLPGDSLLLDLSGVVGIDEFGLGTLLCVNGMAATVGKETYLIAEGSMVAERIKSVGISEIVPMCGHWSDVAFDGRNNRDAANQASLAAAALPMVGLGGGDGFSAVAAHSAHSARSVAGGCAL